MKKIRIFFAMISEGFTGLWKHKSMGVASVLSMFLTLFMFSAILITMLNLTQVVRDVEGKVNEVEVFIVDGVAEDSIEELQTYFESQLGVGSVTYKSKEEALANFQETLGEDGYLVEGMQEALPQSFLVEMQDLAQTNSFIETIQARDEVLEITYYQDLVDRMVQITTYVQYFGVILISVLILISIITIFNTIKLIVYARMKEIQIKKYIGASNPMITSPFIIEGIIFGLLGAVIAFLAIYFFYDFLYYNYNEVIYGLISSYLIDPNLFMMHIAIILLSLGVGIGAVSSLFSVQKYLKV